MFLPIGNFIKVEQVENEAEAKAKAPYLKMYKVLAIPGGLSTSLQQNDTVAINESAVFLLPYTEGDRTKYERFALVNSVVARFSV